MGTLFRPVFRGFPLPVSRPELDSFLGEVFGPVGQSDDRRTAPAGGSPRLNVWEEGDVFYAEAELPGVKAADLELSVVGKQLTIQGRRTESVDAAATFHRRERVTGEFARSVMLPVEVAADHVSASLVNGVLTVRMPKAEAAKPCKIDVAQS